MGQGTEYYFGVVSSDVQNGIVKYGLTRCFQLRKPVRRQCGPDQHEKRDVHRRSLQCSYAVGMGSRGYFSGGSILFQPPRPHVDSRHAVIRATQNDLFSRLAAKHIANSRECGSERHNWEGDN